MISKTYILAPVFLALLFLICLLAVVGTKVLLSPFFKKLSPPPKEQPPTEEKTKVRKNPKPIRSIEINPEEVDRIYVRKN